jgi:hypothetical protein
LGSGSFWLEGVALPLALLALQALPLGALLQLGAAWTTQDPRAALLPGWALLVILIGAYSLARWRARHASLKGWTVAFIGGGGLVTLPLAWYLRLYHTSGPFWQPDWLSALFQDIQSGSGQIVAVFGLLILLALLWWRGLLLGRGKIESEQMSQNFKVGFAVLVVALLLTGTAVPSARSALAAQLGLALPEFLFVGLAGLSLARLAEIRRARRAHGNTQADPTRSWMIAMLVLSGSLVLLTLLIEQAFSYQTLLGVVSALQPVWDVIGTVLEWVVIGLSFVLYWIISSLVHLVRAIFGVGSQNQNTPPSPSPGRPKLPPHTNPGNIPPEWLTVGRWVLIALGIIIALVILLRALRAFAAWRQSDEVEEERESLGATRMLRAQLRAQFANLATRFQRKPTGREQGTDAGQGVRALYRRVLRQAAAQGIGRRLQETPREFAQRLFPELVAPLQEDAVPTRPQPSQVSVDAPVPQQQERGMPELNRLTAAYEQTRYGEQEPPLERIRTLTEDTERLLRQLAGRSTSLPPGRKET